ncbi:retrovirus-related pol polyprotein from transposon TNT 1-94 [Tanacetum coccineum]|uniref:Retrovirus-related pol polyprotein from transposon TNT 1-94 n=1 Tax=Tanacetum coccineum TaxID=301880 RepID=A0ABQ5GY07_9ASTR
MQQPMLNPEDITDPTTAMNMALVLMAKAFKLNYSRPTNNKQRISSNPRNRQIAQPGMNMGQDRHMQIVGGNGGNQFRYNVVVARAKGNAIGNNVRPRRRDTAYLQTQLLIAQKEEAGIQLQAKEFDLMAAVADLNEIEEVNGNCILMANLQQASTLEAAKFVRDFKSLTKEADESLFKHKALELEIECLLRAVFSQDIMSIVQSNSVVDTSKSKLSLNCEECKYDKISYDKAYNDLQQKIRRLQAQLGYQKGKSKDTSCVSNTLDPLSQKLENENAQTKIIIDSLQNKLHDTIYENAKLRAQLVDKVSEQEDTTKGASTNTKFANQSTKRKLSLQHLKNNFVMRPVNAFQSERTKFSKTQVPQKVDEMNDLSNPVTSNSVPTSQESKVVKNDNVIAPEIFRINPSKTSREDKFVSINKVRASVMTNLITVSQPHVIIKKGINSNLNGLSSTGVDNTAKTRRPQPRSNTKNDRVPSKCKSSCIKNKEVEVEEQPKNLLLSKNKKHMSSECNNVKLAIRNDKSKVVCAMCKQCLITANHDICVLNYVNGMNFHDKKQKANVSKTANQKKRKLHVKKPKKVRSKERLASPNPSKPRTCLRRSPTGRICDLCGKIIESSDSKCKSNTFVYDDENDSNPQEPTIKRLPNSTSFLSRVYFVKGKGHNLFSVGQFCDSNLEVTFRRNTCFVRNLEGVDLFKGNSTTNLYTINLYEMASASPICLMDRASYTKLWLWCQRLSHLNFDTINVLAKNDLVTGPPKFKYHKEYLCPKCEQGKSKRASDPPKPVPNSKQRLHLLHMDFCGPMKIASLNGKCVGISHQASSIKTPQQNGVVERRNQTLVEATRTMLIFSRALLFLWAEAIATACYTQNRSIIQRRFNKTPYELINGKKPDISFLHIFGALCYPKNDHEDIGKLSAKCDISFFIGYSADSYAYRVYNRRKKKIIETMNVTFDELSAMAFKQSSSKPKLQGMTSREISSGLDLTYASLTITTQQPTGRELDLLLEAMYDDYIGGQLSAAPRTTPAAQAPLVLQTPTTSTTIADTVLTPTNSFTQVTNIPNTS